MRLVHWVTAAGFAFMWVCGYAMTTMVAEDSALKELLFGLHISSASARASATPPCTTSPRS